MNLHFKEAPSHWLGVLPVRRPHGRALYGGLQEMDLDMRAHLYIFECKSAPPISVMMSLHAAVLFCRV